MFSIIKRKPTVSEKKQDPNVIAVVGSHEILVDRFKKEIKLRGGSHPEKLDKKLLLDEMIEREILIVKAEQMKLNEEPEITRSYQNLLIGIRVSD